MGSLIWQLNDCWPVASWSSIDYYDRWKALQYYARRFYSPVLVSPHVEDSKVEVYVVSDKLQPSEGTLRARIMTMDGRVVQEEKKEISAPALSSASYLEVLFQSIVQHQGDLSQLVLVTDFTTHGEMVSSNVNYLVPTKQVHLLPAAIQSKLITSGKGYKLTLSSPVLARDVYVTFGDLNVQPSDNYFDLIPGEPVTITVTSDLDLEKLQKEMKIVSLVDAFSQESPSQANKAN
jgi:beta-mannosidase